MATSADFPGYADMREALRKAIQLTEIATDWNLDEVEIDGEMVRTRELREEFKVALSMATGGAS